MEFGLTLSAVSLIKSRKSRADVPEHVIQPQPIIPPPEPPKIGSSLFHVGSLSSSFPATR